MPRADPVGLDTQVTSAEAAYLVGVRVGVINNWRNRGWRGPDGELHKLPVVGERAGKPLHRYGDVVQADRETRLSGKSHRRLAPPDLGALALAAA